MARRLPGGRAVSIFMLGVNVFGLDLGQLLLLANQEFANRPTWAFLMPFIIIGLLFYMLMIRPERQKQAAHKERLANLKKSDRVVTAGGIKGIVSNVNRDAEEVVLTIDESTGTKLRVTLASIAHVENGSGVAEEKKK